MRTDTRGARESALEKVVLEKGMTALHPYNDWNVMYGQGTAAVELHEDIKRTRFHTCSRGRRGD